MVVTDWCQCPSCKFPALYSKFKALIETEKVRVCVCQFLLLLPLVQSVQIAVPFNCTAINWWSRWRHVAQRAPPLIASVCVRDVPTRMQVCPMCDQEPNLSEITKVNNPEEFLKAAQNRDDASDDAK
jgi:hypothetical protein